MVKLLCELTVIVSLLVEKLISFVHSWINSKAELVIQKRIILKLVKLNRDFQFALYNVQRLDPPPPNRNVHYS